MPQLLEPNHTSTQFPVRTNVLGVGISALNRQSAVETIQDWLANDARTYVTVTGVHGVMESQQCEQLRQIHNEAGMVTPDGMPMVWLSRLAGNADVSRVYGPNLVLDVCDQTLSQQPRHFFYGGAPGVADELAEALTKRFPGLKVAGTYCPPFRELSESESDEICQSINATQPDIVWVGLSTPKQERWMSAHRDRLNAAVLVGVGAAFDFHTGRVKQAPAWMQNAGLEWFFRLTQEPRRLWRRYLRNNPLFVLYLMLTRCRIRKRPSLE